MDGETIATSTGALVKAGADVNARTDCGAYAPACMQQLTAMSDKPLLALIAAGADLDARNRYHGATPLHAAAKKRPGRNEVITALIAAGADPDARDKEGNTPLEVARAEVKEAAGKSWEENKRAVAATLSTEAIAAVREKARLSRCGRPEAAGRRPA